VATGAAFTLVASLAACSAEPLDPSAEAGSWTVLSYSIADTDLEPYMMDDIDEMGEVGTQEHLNIVALVDRAADYSSDPVLGLDDWVGAKLIEVTEGGGDVLEEMGDINTGDPAVLADFIARGIDAYPADNYALIISDHGASWPGVGADESSDYDSLDLAEISSGIADGLEGAGIEKLDLLGFDACLMATYEVASALAPLADRMLASQELEPGHGWDYTALQVVPDNGGVDADQLSGALIDGFAAQAESQETDAEITLSLVDLTQMAAVDTALAAFSGALVEQAEGVSPVVGRSLASTLGFGRNPDPDQDLYMTDLAILAGQIGVDALNVSDQADDLIRAINDVVLDKVDGQATKGATGLSIYFPPTVDYFNTDYEALEIDGSWLAFLQTYYGTGAAIPADEQAQFVAGDGEVFFDEEGLNIRAEFASGENISEAYVRYGVVEGDGSTTYLGKEPAYLEDDGYVLGSYDLSTMTISDGEDVTGAYLDLTVDADGSFVTFDVPMAYYDPSDEAGETYQDALLSIVLDGDSGDIVSEQYYSFNQDDGTYGELSTEPDGIIMPEQLSVAPDGTLQWFATTEYGLYADLPNLEYDFDDLPSGTVVSIELFAVDFGGNTDSRSATVTIP